MEKIDYLELRKIRHQEKQEKRKRFNLTKREIEVISLIAQGLSTKKVADRLSVSKRTVDFHLQNIYDKLREFGFDIENRMQAYLVLDEHNLIQKPETACARA